MNPKILSATSPTKDDLSIYLIDKSTDIDQLDIPKKLIKHVEKRLGEHAKIVEIFHNSLIYILFLEDKKEDLNVFTQQLRNLGASFTQSFNHQHIKSVFIKNLSQFDRADYMFTEGLALSSYQFEKYKNDKSPNALKTINVYEDVVSQEHLDSLSNLINSVFEARTLVNEPLSYLTAVQLSKEIQRLGKSSGFEVQVYEKKQIESLKMGGLLAVNKGSIDPPTFSILEWKPDNATNSKPIVLVGKGVVYDTGGLSLKPTTKSMDFMKCDMAGAAAVIGAINALTLNKIPVHVIGLIPATDNRPGGNAYAPGDVVKMYDNTTVEVMNTDAEGRMLLADALAYAKKYDPALVIDLATLTGSAVSALGSYAMAMMGTANKEDKALLELCGLETYERLVAFPLWKEYGDLLQSDIADMKNIGGPLAGQITAAKFLEHFTNYPWIHLDIAGPAWLHAQQGYTTKGGSGVGVRLLYHYLKNKAESEDNSTKIGE